MLLLAVVMTQEVQPIKADQDPTLACCLWSMGELVILTTKLMRKKNQIKETNCSCSDKVTFIIIITHFMIVTLSERPKLHICRGWKHPLLLNSLLSSHMAHVGSGQWKNISSPLPLRGSFRSFPFSFRGFVGCVHSLEDCLRM